MTRSKAELKRVPFGKFRWGQALFLFAIWLLFSGKYDLFHLIIGLVSVAGVLWLDRKLGAIDPDGEGEPVNLHYGRGLLYIPWLLWQVVLSTVHVATVVWDPKRLDPMMVRFRSAQPHTVAKVALGNSITLTPGTLTLDIDGDTFLVHALSKDTRESLLDGTMQKKVAHVFGCELREPVTDGHIVEGRVSL